MWRNMKKIFVLLFFLSIVPGIIGCSNHVETNASTAQTDHTSHGYNRAEDTKAKPKQPVPAYQSEASLAKLGPTLPPESFKGEVKAAYAAVREIPKIIARFPCYCNCDRSLGHKSLYSCFEDDPAAGCGICMNSALKAYKLLKEQKMSVEQIRAELIKEYGNA